MGIAIRALAFCARGARRLCNAQATSPGLRTGLAGKPIRFIAPFAPGGPSISLEGARAELAEPSASRSSSTRAGAGGNIGTAVVANRRRTLYRADHFIRVPSTSACFRPGYSAERISFRP